MPDLRVLVVEDDHAQFAFLSRLVQTRQSGSVTLAEASSLAAARAALDSALFDVVLLDLGLPDSSGFTTLRGVLPVARRAAVIVLTSHEDIELASRMVQEGAQDYLVKGRIDADGVARAMRYAVERKRAMDAAQTSERFVRSTLNALQSHIAILDGDGVIVDANQAWRDFGDSNGLQLPRHGVGVNYFDVCRRAADSGDPEAVEVFEALTAVASGRRSECYLEYPCHSISERRWFSMRATPLCGDGPGGVVVAHENITGRVVADQLRRDREALRDAVKAQEQVIGILGHELRTPLAALRATSELLVTQELEPESHERFLTSLHDEVLRMTDFVNNVLEATRINSGLAQWHWLRFAIGPVCEAALETVRPLVGESQLSLDCRVSPPDLRVQGDPEAIRRLLVNLLHNAVKHTRRGTVTLRVRQREEAGRTFMVLRVSDTGEGMPPEIIEKLGQPFALNAGIIGAEHVRGSGLSLAICKGIIEAHGGRLTVRSVIGRGSTITVVLAADLAEPVSHQPAIPLEDL